MKDNKRYEIALRKVSKSKKLNEYVGFIFADWPNFDEHIEWVISASEEEIMDWIEASK